VSKDPAILFYTADFLTGTFTMTDSQVGKYIRLLCLQHQKGWLNEKDMLNICKTYDEEVFSKFVKDGDIFYNERMKFEHEKRIKYSKSRAENRKVKAEKPLKSSKKKPKNISSSYDKHMENENENINENINEVIYPFTSEKFKKIWQFWKDYKKQEHKFTYKTKLSEQAALKSIGELSKNNEETAVAIIQQSISNGWKGFFELKDTSNGKFNSDKDKAEWKRVFDKHTA